MSNLFVETCSSFGPFFGTCVDAVEGTAVDAWGSCHRILQGCPSPKNDKGCLGPGSVDIWGVVHLLFQPSLPVPSVLWFSFWFSPPPNKVVSFALCLVSSVSSGRAPMVGLTQDQATHLLSWGIVHEALPKRVNVLCRNRMVSLGLTVASWLRRPAH